MRGCLWNQPEPGNTATLSPPWSGRRRRKLLFREGKRGKLKAKNRLYSSDEGEIVSRSFVAWVSLNILQMKVLIKRRSCKKTKALAAAPTGARSRREHACESRVVMQGSILPLDNQGAKALESGRTTPTVLDTGADANGFHFGTKKHTGHYGQHDLWALGERERLRVTNGNGEI